MIVIIALKEIYELTENTHLNSLVTKLVRDLSFDDCYYMCIWQVLDNSFNLQVISMSYEEDID